MHNFEPNTEEAISFLRTINEDGIITFQIYDDKKITRRAEHFTGSIDDPAVIQKLVDENRRGCGIYFMLNEGDGHGRSEVNVTNIRVLAVDLDGAPLGPVLESKLSPQVVVETSSGRYHAYYLIEPKKISEFETFEAAKAWFGKYQGALARKFHGDESCIDLCRVFRVPGFWHLKHNPFRCQIINEDLSLPYTVEQIVEALDLKQTVEQVETERKAPLPPIDQVRIKTGERHRTLLRYASKYAHVYRLGEQERWWLLQGMNRNVCETPIDEYDLNRINVQASRYAAEERAKVEAVDISALLEKHKAVSEKPETLSDKLLNPPGLVGDVMHYILSTSTKPQPELALGAAFAACATVMGRKIRTESNLRTNLYFLSLIETGGGKDWPRQAIKIIFEAMGRPERAQLEDVTSDSSIADALARTPSQVFLLDEIGRFMKAATASHAAAHLAAVPTFLIKLYSCANTSTLPKAFADPKNNRPLRQPNISLLATSIEENFYKSITKESVSDGLLNRFLFLQSIDPDPHIREVSHNAPPEELIERFREWENLPYGPGNLGSLENSETVPPEPRIVPFAEGAKEVFRTMEQDLRVYRKDLRKEGMSGLFTRCYENALKIALVLAAGQNIEVPEISVADAEYACEFVLTTTRGLMRAVKRNVSDSRVEANHKIVLNYIREAGPEGIELKVLGKRTKDRGLDRRTRDDILKELIEWGQVIKDEVLGSTKRTTLFKFVVE